MAFKEEKKEYHRMYDKILRQQNEYYEIARYKVIKDNDVRFFVHKKDLLNFIGYSSAQVCRFIKTGKLVCGYKIEKIDWWKNQNDIHFVKK